MSANYFVKVGLDPASYEKTKTQLLELGRLASVGESAAGRATAAPVAAAQNAPVVAAQKAEQAQRDLTAVTKSASSSRVQATEREVASTQTQIRGEKTLADLRARAKIQSDARIRTNSSFLQEKNRLESAYQTDVRQPQRLEAIRAVAGSTSRQTPNNALDRTLINGASNTKLSTLAMSEQLATGNKLEQGLARLHQSANLTGSAERAFAQQLSVGTFNMKTLGIAALETSGRIIAFSAGTVALFAVFDAIKNIGEAAVETDKTMVDLSRVVGSSFDRPAAVAQFSQLLQQTNVTALEAHDALFGVGQVVHDQSKAFEGAHAVLTAYKIDQVDITDGTKQFAQVVNAFKSEGIGYTDVIDKIDSQYKSLGVSVPKTLTALARSAPVVKLAGGDINQLTARLAVGIRLSGYQAETVARANARVAQQVLSPVGQAKITKSLEGTGIHILDKEGEVRNIDDILKDIGGKFNTFNKEQQAAVSLALSGSRQGGLSVIMQSTLAQYGLVQKQANISATSQGRAEKDLQKVLGRTSELIHSIAVEFQALGATLSESGALEIAGGLLVALRDTLHTTNDLVAAFNEFPEHKLLLLAGVLGAAAKVVGGKSGAISGALTLAGRSGAVVPGGGATAALAAQQLTTRQLAEVDTGRAASAAEVAVADEAVIASDTRRTAAVAALVTVQTEEEAQLSSLVAELSSMSAAESHVAGSTTQAVDALAALTEAQAAVAVAATDTVAANELSLTTQSQLIAAINESASQQASVAASTAQASRAESTLAELRAAQIEVSFALAEVESASIDSVQALIDANTRLSSAEAAVTELETQRIEQMLTEEEVTAQLTALHAEYELSVINLGRSIVAGVDASAAAAVTEGERVTILSTLTTTEGRLAAFEAERATSISAGVASTIKAIAAEEDLAAIRTESAVTGAAGGASALGQTRAGRVSGIGASGFILGGIASTLVGQALKSHGHETTGSYTSAIGTGVAGGALAGSFLPVPGGPVVGAAVGGGIAALATLMSAQAKQEAEVKKNTEAFTDLHRASLRLSTAAEQASQSLDDVGSKRDTRKGLGDKDPASGDSIMRNVRNNGKTAARGLSDSVNDALNRVPVSLKDNDTTINTNDLAGLLKKVRQTGVGNEGKFTGGALDDILKKAGVSYDQFNKSDDPQVLLSKFSRAQATSSVRGRATGPLTTAQQGEIDAEYKAQMDAFRRSLQLGIAKASGKGAGDQGASSKDREILLHGAPGDKLRILKDAQSALESTTSSSSKESSDAFKALQEAGNKAALALYFPGGEKGLNKAIKDAQGKKQDFTRIQQVINSIAGERASIATDTGSDVVNAALGDNAKKRDAALDELRKATKGDGFKSFADRISDQGVLLRVGVATQNKSMDAAIAELRAANRDFDVVKKDGTQDQIIEAAKAVDDANNAFQTLVTSRVDDINKKIKSGATKKATGVQQIGALVGRVRAEPGISKDVQGNILDALYTAQGDLIRSVIAEQTGLARAVRTKSGRASALGKIANAEALLRTAAKGGSGAASALAKALAILGISEDSVAKQEQDKARKVLGAKTALDRKVLAAAQALLGVAKALGAGLSPAAIESLTAQVAADQALVTGDKAAAAQFNKDAAATARSVIGNQSGSGTGAAAATRAAADAAKQANDDAAQKAKELRDARADYYRALSEDDPIASAKQDVASAKQAVAAATTAAESFSARAQLIRAQHAQRDAVLASREDDIKFELEMKQITVQKALGMYRSLLKLKDLTKAQRRDITREIHSLSVDAAQDATFGLPTDLRLPSAFEVKSAVNSGLRQGGVTPATTAGKDGIGAQIHHSAVSTNSTVNNNSIIIQVRNTADLARVRKTVENATSEQRQRNRNLGFSGGGL